MPASPDAGPEPESDPFDHILRSFHDMWRESEVDLLSFWLTHQSSGSLTLLTALIKIDIYERFERGRRPTAAHYLDLFPELVADKDRVVSLVYEEFCLLEENNERPDVDQFCGRYEAWSDSLRSQLAYHRELSQAIGLPRARARYPMVGERFGSYHLRSILGKGGAAQVYLASDGLVGDREVVLKLSDSIGVEPKILARLHHKNIVPILTVAESPDSGLQGICMPYLPGQTLESVLNVVAAANQPRRASTILDLFHAEEEDEDVQENAWKDFPAAGTYTEAVAWLGVRIANALAYLHHLDIYHRDIKPANILITHRHGPLLFDFNLAHKPDTAEFAQAAVTGGTLPYMAPEQLHAFLDPAAWGEVKASADIYAFGLLLREMVTCRKPKLPDPNLPVGRAIQEMLDWRREPLVPCREIQGDVPPSLDSIIMKCLAYHPVDRYASARDVSRDLRCFLNHQPLVIATNSSRVEMAINWGYRSRKLAAYIGLGLVFALFFYGLRPAHRDRPDDRPPVLRATPPAKPTLTDRPEFLQGKSLLNSSDPADLTHAADLFRRLAKEEPRSAWPLLYQALLAVKQDNSNEVQERLHEAIKQPDALDVFTKRLAESPDDITVRVALGDLHRLQKDFQGAENELLRAKSHDPDHPGVLIALGDLRLAQQEFQAAIDFYSEAIDSPVTKGGRWAPAPHVRPNLIAALINEIKGRLASPAFPLGQIQPAGLRWPGVDELIVKLAAQIDQIEAQWQDTMQQHPGSFLECSLKTCRAACLSARAMFDFHDGDEKMARARADFCDVSRLLVESRTLARELPRNRVPELKKVAQVLDCQIERIDHAAFLAIRGMFDFLDGSMRKASASVNFRDSSDLLVAARGLAEEYQREKKPESEKIAQALDIQIKRVADELRQRQQDCGISPDKSLIAPDVTGNDPGQDRRSSLPQ